ncbi:MAG: hypothetical protein GXO47_00030 [Chlorobi bacterium]|nr:hypothetical protein [Chlorobiota bacterium]
MRRIISLLPVLVFLLSCSSGSNKSDERNDIKLEAPQELWHINQKKGGISWEVNAPHTDNLEFSGLRVSAIIYYGADSLGNVVLNKKVVWPMLRTIPNDTHASLIHDYGKNENSVISVNGKSVENEKLYRVDFNGILTLSAKTDEGVEIVRILSPSTDKPAIVENITITNKSGKDVEVEAGKLEYEIKTPADKGVYGSYSIRAYSEGDGKITLKDGEKFTFSQIYIATKKGEKYIVDASEEIEKRGDFIKRVKESLVLESPDPYINEMFSFAKLRAVESIFATKGGLMHGPGGSRYYAAIWANDQAEYVNPFFPFLGIKTGNESAINSFRHFARFMNDKFEPIPSSIIAEGTDIWNGAGDRGDAAMIAYGASRFALAYGDPAVADSLLPLIKWCINYSEHKMLPEGIIASDCDELEHRFPAGKANLTTNMLAYGAYLSAADLLDALGKEHDLAEEYRSKASKLRVACENYFGSNVEGFETYRYYDGNTKLRSWICMPLTMGVFDRKDATLDALFSDKLWTKDGILTESGDKTFWDRATLYAFRGIFKAGETDRGMKYFEYYSRKRLLGNHVPYAVEAWPEGNQRHLSAESGLYCRVITEGLFDITPTGFRTFTMTPRLPSDWNFMRLKHIKAFGSDFNIDVKRDKDKIIVEVTKGDVLVKKTDWDGKSEIKVNLNNTGKNKI